MTVNSISSYPLTLIIWIGITYFALWQFRRSPSQSPPDNPEEVTEKGPDALAFSLWHQPSAATSSTGRRLQDANLTRVAESSSHASGCLSAIRAADDAFEIEAFLNGACAVYEAVTMAFAKGERDVLASLLSPEVYEVFRATIAARESRGASSELSFVTLGRPRPVDASVSGGTARISVRFVGQFITATRLANGELIDGDPTKTIKVTDVWTFAREVALPGRVWKLVATG